MDTVGISSPSLDRSAKMLASPEIAPAADYSASSVSNSSARMVTRDTSLSILVKDVPTVIKKIESSLASYGGFMVNSYLNQPEMAPSGSITIRVLTDKRQEALDYFKSLGVKVVSENVSGRDITDQYTDVEARLAVLNNTKTRLEALADRYGTITDLMNVQREMLNIQSQIDSLKGQEKYLSESVKYSLISLHLSTDELALPYAPDNAWRPALIFKQAVRSLVGNIRSLGTMAIWLAVYSPLFLVIIGVVWYLKSRYYSHK
jgi:hypothetical protein